MSVNQISSILCFKNIHKLIEWDDLKFIQSIWF